MGYVIIGGERVHTSLLPRLNNHPLNWISPEESLELFKKSKNIYDRTIQAMSGVEYKISSASTGNKKVARSRATFKK